jgi:diketogulonate reductase-like aldo/keto reductase
LTASVLPITTSSSRERAAGYIAAGDIDLRKHEIEAIDKAGSKDARMQDRKAMVLRGLKGVVALGALAYMGRSLLV